MSNWYLLRDGNQYGPYAWQQVLNLKEENSILNSDLVWSEELEEWTPLSKVSNLFSNDHPNDHPLENWGLTLIIYVARKWRRPPFPGTVCRRGHSR